MDKIMFVDGYDAPLGFDGHKKTKKRKATKRRHKKGSHKMTPAKLCAGAKRKKACLKAVRTRKCK